MKGYSVDSSDLLLCVFIYRDDLKAALMPIHAEEHQIFCLEVPETDQSCWRHMLRACCCCGAVLWQLASRLMGPAVKACSLFLRKVFAKLLFCLLYVLVLLLACFRILMNVVPALLVITGNRKSLSKLEVGMFGSLITHCSNSACSTKVCMLLLPACTCVSTHACSMSSIYEAVCACSYGTIGSQACKYASQMTP